MKKLSILSIVLCLSFGCSSTLGINKYTGFTEVVFPSSIFSPGQIVEIYSKPRKVELTYNPQIEFLPIQESRGWDIQGTEALNMLADIETEIEKILTANASYKNSLKSEISLSETGTRVIPKNIIYQQLQEDLKDKKLQEQLQEYKIRGTKFCVITAVLTAKVTIRITGAKEIFSKIYPSIQEELHSKINISLKKDGENSATFSCNENNLVVGIHYDPIMIDILMKDNQKGHTNSNH